MFRLSVAVSSVSYLGMVFVFNYTVQLCTVFRSWFLNNERKAMDVSPVISFTFSELSMSL